MKSLLIFSLLLLVSSCSDDDTPDSNTNTGTTHYTQVFIQMDSAIPKVGYYVIGVAITNAGAYGAKNIQWATKVYKNGSYFETITNSYAALASHATENVGYAYYNVAAGSQYSFTVELTKWDTE